MEAYFDNESGESLVDNETVLDDIGGCSNTESSEMQSTKGGWCQGEDGVALFENSEIPLEQDKRVDCLSSEGVMNVVEEPGVQSFEASLEKVVSTGFKAAVLSNRISPAVDGEMSPVVHTRVLVSNCNWNTAPRQTDPQRSSQAVPESPASQLHSLASVPREQKCDQARHESPRPVPSVQIPSVPKQQLPRKDQASANSVPELNVIEENLRVEATVTKCQPISKKLVKDKTFQDGELANKDMAAVFVTEKSAENAIEVCRGVTSHATVVSSGGSVGSSYRDPGTSPLEANPQKDSPDCHGTLISLLRVHDGFLISAESRLNECEFIVSGNYVPILKSDIENKIRLIVPTVVVGASGSVRRIHGLWSYLEEKVKKEDDVVSILNKVEEYIRRVKLREKSCGMELFVVGLSNHTKKCIAFKTGDIDTDTISETFAAIGSGARIAYDRFSSFTKRTFRGNMNDEIAGYYMLDILLQATLGDISCGGLFHTWKITSQLCCKLTPQGGIHVTDAAILMHRKFEEFKKIQCFGENQLFVFCQSTYFMANYAYTFADLQSLGVSPKTWPSCLGHIRGRWKLFVATLKDLQEVRTVFEKGDKITSKTGIKPGVRQLQFSRCDRKGMYLMTIKVVILMATLDNLEMARETPYLDELLPH